MSCLSLWCWPRTQTLGEKVSARTLTVAHTSAARSPGSLCPGHWEGLQDTRVLHRTPDTGSSADVPEAPGDQPGFCGPRLLPFTVENINQHSLILVFSSRNFEWLLPSDQKS